LKSAKEFQIRTISGKKYASFYASKKKGVTIKILTP
jgi:hypothetical protein